MGFLLYLFLIVALIVLLPIIRLAWTARRMIKDTHRVMREQQQAMGGDFSDFSSRQDEEDADARRGSAQEKVFHQDQGEYVSYEEVTGEEAKTEVKHLVPKDARIDHSISDAKYEEIE